MTWTLILAGWTWSVEYTRGFCSTHDSDLVLEHDQSLRFHNLDLEDQSFFPDDSPIPNAFVPPLAKFDLVGAVKALTAPYYGVRIFVHPDSPWGFGLDFTHYKVLVRDESRPVRVSGDVHETVPLNRYMQRFEASHGVNFVALAVRYQQPLWWPWLSPFAALSLGPMIPHTEVWDASGRRRAYSYQVRWGNFGAGLHSGARLHIGKRWALLAEYKLTYGHLGNMVFDDDDRARLRMDIWTHHLQWGLAYVR
jgi:hypothetical protein